MEASEVEYIGFWLRFLAFLIDSIVVAIILIPVVTVFIGETQVADYDLQNQAEVFLLLKKLSLQWTVEILFIGTVFVLFWIFKSATPGKMLFKIFIVDARTLGKANARQNIVRYLGYFLSLIPFGLGFLWIAIDHRKQGWHDKIANTVVIRGKPGNSGD